MIRSKRKLEAAWKKAKNLEEGKRQFDFMPKAQESAYVSVGGIMMPVCIRAGR